MIISFLKSSNNILIVFSLSFIFLVACTELNISNTANSCIIFEDKKNWYKATKNSYDKWKVPIAFQLAVINQESSFQQFAKPKRKKFLGFIPLKRPSTAFGFAQVTNPTWQWYKTKTNKQNASRANFNDVTDFIGWYSDQSLKMLGISKKDYFNQYLAYHEGHGGWKKNSYKSKKWLIKAAKNVESNAKKYNKQLKQCENKLNKKNIFGII